MKIQDALDLHLKEEASRIIGENSQVLYGLAFNKIFNLFQQFFVFVVRKFPNSQGQHGHFFEKLYVRFGAFNMLRFQLF